MNQSHLTENSSQYSVAAIRKLLHAAFAAEELRRFCQDRSAFRPIMNRFGPGLGFDEMVDRVVDYCEKQRLFDELLAETKEANPRQYARFESQFIIPAEELAKIPCPYRGLEPFEAEHAEFYFGRKDMVKRLVAKVKESALVAVVGSSGCGKSSLVRAGLVTALLDDALGGSQEWAVHLFRPGSEPLRAISMPLVTLLEPEATEVARMIEARQLANHLAGRTLSLADVAARLREKHSTLPRVALIADQFEELYTECQNEALRQAFVETLLEAAGRGITVVLALRADFYGHVLANRDLAKAIDAGLFNVLPMSEAELREATESPALRAGRTFQPGLIDRILEDVAEQPGNLPLLEFALTELWWRQTAQGVLTHDAYKAIGKVAGAIAQRADAVYKELEAKGQGEIVRRIFLQLTHCGEGAEITRRRAILNELETYHMPQAAVEQVVRVLANARLLVTGRDDATKAPTVEMVHEALIQRWEQLHEWIKNDRSFVLWQQHLTAMRKAWEEKEHDEGALLRGALLSEAESWLIRRGGDLNEGERAFIEGSLDLHRREVIERERQRQRELENVRRLAELQTLSNRLEILSAALAGGRDLPDLLKQIVSTLAHVIGANASSLYLVDETTGRLVIRAAAGYAAPLVESGTSYRLGEGVTGWVAENARTFRANSLEELRRSPLWRGKQDEIQGTRQLDSFLGLPLRVIDPFTGQERVIGVLKVEDIQPSAEHPESFFTDQDVLLIEMMANIIATVVYNTQTSNDRLRALNSNLTQLSSVLAGGQDLADLLRQVVGTIAQVVGADASSLYLFDETTQRLVIRAAAGYAAPLVESGASYRLGEGITGWIAQNARIFRANSLEELRRSPLWRGKQDEIQGTRQPDSFLGLPLRVMDPFTGQERVIGVLTVEGIQPSTEHPESFFTDQDVLLIEMMANVIALVIHSTTSRIGRSQ